MAIGDNARELLAKAYSLERPTRLLLNSELVAPKLFETPDTNPSFFYTTGVYNLTFRRYTHTQNLNKKRYCLKVDFLPRGFVKFNNWEEFVEAAANSPIINFLKEYTNISEQLFNIASQNESMIIPVVINLEKYDSVVRPQLKAPKDRYAMIYNSYKPCFGTHWSVNEKGEIYMISPDKEEQE